MSKRYIDMKHFIRNGLTPGRAALRLMEFEEHANAPIEGNVREKSYLSFCKRMVRATFKPSRHANTEMRRFLQETMEARGKFKAMTEAQWKTAFDEGYEACQPLQDRFWREANNPYERGTIDWDWWDEGYYGAAESWVESGVRTQESVQMPPVSHDDFLTLTREVVATSQYDFVAVSTVFFYERLYYQFVIGCPEFNRLSIHVVNRLKRKFERQITSHSYADCDVITSRQTAMAEFERLVSSATRLLKKQKAQHERVS